MVEQQTSAVRTILGVVVLCAGIATIASMLLLLPFMAVRPLLSYCILLCQFVSGLVAIIVGVRTSQAGELV